MGISRLLQLFVALMLTMSFVYPVEVLAAARSTSVRARSLQSTVAARRTIAKAKTSTARLTKKSATTKKSTKNTVAKKSVAKGIARKATARKTTAQKLQRKSKVTRVAVHRARRKGQLGLRHTAGRKQVKAKVVAVAKKAPKYAYPADIFMWTAPETAALPMSSSTRKSVRKAFNNGVAGKFSPQQLVQSDVFEEDPLLGGIFVRREGVRYIVMHSTETERPADAPRVIHSWNRGMRHPGAQYVVDRNGKIYQTVDPKFATVHVNIFRTENGVNNDNSIGIEIVRAGKQKYTSSQLESVMKLVTYIQNRFDVTDACVVGHGQIQPSDRSDPVNFDWTAFSNAKANLKMHSESLALKRRTQSWIIPFHKDDKPYDGPRPTDVSGPAAEDELDESELDESTENI